MDAAKGPIRQRGSGSFQLRVYRGTDPTSGKRRLLLANRSRRPVRCQARAHKTPKEPTATVSEVIRFADCELNLDRVVLRRGGEEIRVEPQVFDVLAYLVKHRGAVVRKEELLDAIWGDRFVSESALTTRIKAVRQAVGDDGSQQLIIRTVHGKGYEFVATVEEIEEGPDRGRICPLLPRERRSASGCSR